MARGLPDGGLSAYQYAAQAIDPAVIYQFLWGFSPVDSQGRLFFLDTFNNGIVGWLSTTTGGGGASVAALDTTQGDIYSPPQGIILSPGSTVDDRTLFFRQMFMGKTLRVGFESVLGMQSTTPEIRWQLDYKPLDQQSYFPILRWYPTGMTWDIWTNTGWVTILDVGSLAPDTTPIFIQVKIVCDFSTGKWVRVYIGDNLFDVSSHLMDLSSSSYDGMLIGDITAVSDGSGGSALIGYALFTKDEP